MKDFELSKRYAKAFMELVAPAEHNDLLEDVRGLQEVLTENPEIIRSVHMMILSYPRKKKLVETLAEKLNFPELWRSLFVLLVKKHRFAIVQQILHCIEDFILEESNRVKVVLSLAREHDPDTMRKITRLLEDILKKSVEFKTRIKPELIAGFHAETSSLIIDGSVKNNLERFIKEKIPQN